MTTGVQEGSELADVLLQRIAQTVGGKANVSTILREGQDGHWHHAEREWSEAVAKVLTRPN